MKKTCGGGWHHRCSQLVMYHHPSLRTLTLIQEPPLILHYLCDMATPLVISIPKPLEEDNLLEGERFIGFSLLYRFYSL